MEVSVKMEMEIRRVRRLAVVEVCECYLNVERFRRSRVLGEGWKSDLVPEKERSEFTRRKM